MEQIMSLCFEQRCERGGNAANMATVLAALNCRVTFLGTLPKGPFLQFLRDDFNSYGIDISQCDEFAADTPISCVVRSRATGSRTIVHSNRNLAEVTAEKFATTIRDTTFDWIHFEGRNAAAVRQMIDQARQMFPSTPVSVELEKPGKADLDSLLLAGADAVFVSKDYAQHRGYRSMQECVLELSKVTSPSCFLTCAWGEKGAAAVDAYGALATSVAHPPAAIVDTLGAGDTFNATVIWCLCRKMTVAEVLDTACRVAGAKIGLNGFKPLRSQLQEMKII